MRGNSPSCELFMSEPRLRRSLFGPPQRLSLLGPTGWGELIAPLALSNIALWCFVQMISQIYRNHERFINPEIFAVRTGQFIQSNGGFTGDSSVRWLKERRISQIFHKWNIRLHFPPYIFAKCGVHTYTIRDMAMVQWLFPANCGSRLGFSAQVRTPEVCVS